MADVITSSIDLKRMAEEATAAGFNPLSVLRSGLAAGWARQTTQYGETVVGGVLAPPPTGGPAAPAVASPMPEGTYNPGGGKLVGGGYYEPDAGHAWDPTVIASMTSQDHRSIFGGSSEPASSDPWGEESERNIAIHQARLRTGDVITDDGVRIPTRAARERVAQAGGMFAPLSYSGSNTYVHPGGALSRPIPVSRPTAQAKPGQSFIERDGWQERQVYEPDKLPNIIHESTWHTILPGVWWEELGGVSRGETGETVYGEEGLGSLFGVPKGMNDIGHNANRLYDHLGGPRIGDFLGKEPRGLPRLGADGKIYYTGGGF